jgi:diguanylate cyclase (GGDEF)-like protein
MVCVTLIIILFVYYRDFAGLVDIRQALTNQQRETQELSDDNFRLANLDSLTGLSNRRHFFAALEQLFDGSVAERIPFAIGIIDLDGFKPVNDTYGHQTGDRVLIEAGRRLAQVCGDQVLLSRLGGDEFGIIVKGDLEEDDLLSLGARISRIIELPFQVASSQALIGSSIGIALYPRSAENVDGVFERADYALYSAKRHKRGGTVIFSESHEEEIQNHSVIEHALQTADLDTEFFMMFQPIFDIRLGHTVAFEALARWNSPVLGAIAPSTFIPVAERAGLISNLTKAFMRKALLVAAQWPEQIRLSFNLSAHDLGTSENVLSLISLIHQSGIAPKRIDIEITETATSHDFEQAISAIQALKALGVGISLDDFGTGFSSLSHVHRLPLDKIKIDRSFIADITHDNSSLKIVKSLVTLCNDMNLGCVVEGVESPSQLEILKRLGCSLIQGHYFATPMSGAAVLPYLSMEGRGKKASGA